MKRFCVVAAALLSAVLFNCSAAPKPELLVIDSENLGAIDSVLVFSPRKAVKNNLILLHGRNGYGSEWSKRMDIQKLCDDTGFRIICPEGFKYSWYMDNEGGMLWRKFFWDELWPLLDRKYGLDPDHTFIDGLSMGGNGAVNIFLDRPDRFRGAGSMSGVLDLTHSNSCAKDLGKARGTGELPVADIIEMSAVTRLPRLGEICGEKAGEKVLLISSGDQDRYAKTAQEFCDRCHELGYRNILMITPGKHKWPVWIWTLRYHLDWFAQVASGGSLGEKL